MSDANEINKLPLILTAIGTVLATVAVLHFYGYLNFVREEEGLLVAEFSLITLGSEEAGQASDIIGKLQGIAQEAGDGEHAERARWRDDDADERSDRFEDGDGS